MTFATYAAQARVEIDAALAQECDAFSCSAELRAAMRYALLGPGKRLRPMLTLLACEACGGERAAAMLPACAVESVHAFSLVHDDLPALDNDDLRRGRPTTHIAFGEAQAVLAGDALLSLAFSLLGQMPDAIHARECTAVLADAAGPAGMIGGQWDDVLPPPTVTEEYLASLHGRKTGALISASLLMGGIVANASPASMDALALFGARFGLGYQIADDLLDTEGDERQTGKRTGKDARFGKHTFPSLLGAEESRARLTSLTEEAAVAAHALGARGAMLGELARSMRSRTA